MRQVILTIVAASVAVGYYADLLWRRRALLVACGLVGLLLGLVVALVQTPEYEAAVMLEIEPPQPTFMTVTDALVGAGGYWQNTDYYNTQFIVLKSKGLAERVVRQLKLTLSWTRLTPELAASTVV